MTLNRKRMGIRNVMTERNYFAANKNTNSRVQLQYILRIGINPQMHTATASGHA